MDELPLCECGCGLKVAKEGNCFIHGHHIRGDGNPMKNPDTAKKISDIVKKQWEDKDYRDVHSGKNHQQYDSVELICEFCGEEYTVQSHRKDISRFCSVGCMDKNRSIEYVGENGANWKGGKVTIICETCGDEFEGDPYQERVARFCSIKCRSIWMAKEFSGENAFNYGREVSYDEKVKISCGAQGIEIEDFDGFISDSPYCPKFNDRLRQQVRDNYNNCDYFSGLPDYICNVLNDKIYKLSIHHVDYNKAQGCDGHRWRLVPLSRSNHAKTHGNRIFWEKLICYALKYDETYYNIKQIDIMEMIKWKQTTEVISNTF